MGFFVFRRKPPPDDTGFFVFRREGAGGKGRAAWIPASAAAGLRFFRRRIFVYPCFRFQDIPASSRRRRVSRYSRKAASSSSAASAAGRGFRFPPFSQAGADG